MGPVRIGGQLYLPIGGFDEPVAPSTRDMLRMVLNSGYDQARLSVAAASIPQALQDPRSSPWGAALTQMAITGAQVATNAALQPRDVMYSQNGQVIYTPPLDQRYVDPNGWGGQYGNQQIMQAPPGGVGTYMPYSAPINPSVVYGSNAATANSATVGSGFAPTGNSTYDLANAIANAPTYSPTEMALLSKIKDPEQRAIQELQMQMQKQALLCTVLTNLANMRHEMLKAVAQNLRS